MEHAVKPPSDHQHRRPAERMSRPASATKIADDRPQALALRALADSIHNSPKMVAQRKQLGNMFGGAAQLEGGSQEEGPLEDRFAPAQRKGLEQGELPTKKSPAPTQSGPAHVSNRLRSMWGDVTQLEGGLTGEPAPGQSVQRRVDAVAPADDNGAPIQLQDDIGLGFSDLADYGQDDAFGARSASHGNLAKFRAAVDAKGPGAFVKGVESQRVGGGIQKVFTQGIKQAMVKSLHIKQNLAGFTDTQIGHARNHAPMLSDSEAQAARRHSIYAGYDAGSAELWSGMSDVPVPEGGWGKDIAAISVWELSHMLHNSTLFDKTYFYNYDESGGRSTAPLTPSELSARGIVLNDHDLKDLAELGIDAEASDTSGNWFTALFGACFGWS